MFDAVPKISPVPLTQSCEFMRALRLMGATVEEVTLTDGVLDVGHAYMQTRWFPPLGWLGLISRGPIWDGQPHFDLLAQSARDLGHPLIVNAHAGSGAGLRAAGFVQLMTPAVLARMDLTGGAAAIRGRMHQKWRNRLVSAESGPLSTQHSAMPDDPGHWLLEAETEQRSARRYRGLPVSFVTAFARANPGRSHLFTAFLNREPVAAMLFLQHGTAATYHIGHTFEAGRRHNAHTCLLAEAAIWLADQGVELLELGTLDTENAPGLARFKLGSGARPFPLGGTWLFSRWLAPLARAYAPRNG